MRNPNVQTGQGAILNAPLVRCQVDIWGQSKWTIEEILLLCQAVWSLQREGESQFRTEAKVWGDTGPRTVTDSRFASNSSRLSRRT